MSCRVSELYDLSHTIAAELFAGLNYPWEALPVIGTYIRTLGESLDPEIFEKRGEDIWVARSAKVAPTADLTGPLIIDENAQIRHCAFIRGKVIVGKDCVVGNSTELKNSVLFDHVQVPHYNYVGDSILGYHAHMGAGSITSNVKADRTVVVVKDGSERTATGLKKFGAMIGDYVEIGCNAVLNPGTVVGRNTNIYPLSMVRGVIPPNSVYKTKNEIVEKKALADAVQPAASAPVPEPAAGVTLNDIMTMYTTFEEDMRSRQAGQSVADRLGSVLAGSRKKDPLQDAFAEQIREACGRLAEQPAASGELTEILNYMYTAHLGHKENDAVRLMIIAVQQFTMDLIPLLNQEDAASLLAVYEKALPRRERMPCNVDVYKRLKKQAA